VLLRGDSASDRAVLQHLWPRPDVAIEGHALRVYQSGRFEKHRRYFDRRIGVTPADDNQRARGGMCSVADLHKVPVSIRPCSTPHGLAIAVCTLAPL
jgi:hypothetical protein